MGRHQRAALRRRAGFWSGSWAAWAAASQGTMTMRAHHRVMDAQPHALQLAFRRAEANVQMHKGRRLLHAAVKSAALPRPRRRPRRLGQQLHGGPRVGVRDDGTGGQNLKAQRLCGVGGCGRRLARAPEAVARAPEAVAGRIVAWPPPLGVPSRPEPRRHALGRCRSRARAVPRGSLWALWTCCRTSPPRSVTPTARPDSSTLMRSTCVLRRTVPPCRSMPRTSASITAPLPPTG